MMRPVGRQGTTAAATTTTESFATCPPLPRRGMCGHVAASQRAAGVVWGGSVRRGANVRGVTVVAGYAAAAARSGRWHRDTHRGGLVGRLVDLVVLCRNRGRRQQGVTKTKICFSIFLCSILPTQSITYCRSCLPVKVRSSSTENICTTLQGWRFMPSINTC